MEEDIGVRVGEGEDLWIYRTILDEAQETIRYNRAKFIGCAGDSAY